MSPLRVVLNGVMYLVVFPFVLAWVLVGVPVMLVWKLARKK